MSNASSVRFNDGAGYERLMGQWSRPAGETFLDWLALPPGLRWLDVGCGNGAFTEVVATRCAPARLDGVDPSEGQLAFARTRPGTPHARYAQGDAMALRYPDATFDVAVMALVIFFVPEPTRGVAEMRRVARPGGTIAAYAWDMHGGGFPYDALTRELRAAGVPPAKPPSVDASRLDTMSALWRDAGLTDVQTRQIVVRRTFDTFDEWWAIARLSVAMAEAMDKLPEDTVQDVRERVRARLSAGSGGSFSCEARANAVKGRVGRG